MGDTQEVIPLAECSEGHLPPTATSSVLSSLLRPPWPAALFPRVSTVLPSWPDSVCVCGRGPPPYSQIAQNRKVPCPSLKHCALGGTALSECPALLGWAFRGAGLRVEPDAGEVTALRV